MIRILTIAALLFSGLFSFAQTVEVRGTVKTKMQPAITLYKVEDGQLVSVKGTFLGKDGSFDLTFEPSYEGFYAIGGATAEILAGHFPLYLKKGDKVEVVIEDKHIEFIGKQTPENAVLASWIKLTEGLKNKSVFYLRSASTFHDFFPDFKAVNAKTDAFRKTIKTKNAKFNEQMKGLTYFDMDFYALNFLKTPRSVQPAQTDLISYYNTIVVKDKFKTDDVLSVLYGMQLVCHYADYAAKQNNSSEGFNYLSTDAQKGVYVFNRDAKKLKTYAEFQEMMAKYGRYFQTAALKSKVQALETKLYNSTPGRKGSNFSFPDKDGKMVSLSDLKGKVVLVDVWATYCGPCKELIPSLNKLEADLHDNKDIVFVSVAVDGSSAKNTWLKMIKEKQMGGIQLFAGGPNNVLNNDYKIKAMPCFLVFDRNGNLVTANAPIPGPGLKEVLLAEANK